MAAGGAHRGRARRTASLRGPGKRCADRYLPLRYDVVRAKDTGSVRHAGAAFAQRDVTEQTSRGETHRNPTKDQVEAGQDGEEGDDPPEEFLQGVGQDDAQGLLAAKNFSAHLLSSPKVCALPGLIVTFVIIFNK